MKRSLLLIKVLVLMAAACAAQDSRTIPNIAKPAAGRTHAAAAHKSAAAKKSNANSTAKKATVHREITHTAPDQRRIDSIKAVQMKGKK